jgi:hypothetical protein
MVRADFRIPLEGSTGNWVFIPNNVKVRLTQSEESVGLADADEKVWLVAHLYSPVKN